MIKSFASRALPALLLTGGIVALSIAPPSGGGASPQPGDEGSTQGVQAAISSQVSWGSAGGCTQNIQTNDFGELTPSAGASILSPFAALPEAQASTDAHGNKVWVGCVSSNGPLMSVVAQGIQNMTDADSDVLALSDVAIGVSNQPGGKPSAECAIAADQSQAGSCTLPDDGNTVRTLAGEGPAGTTELDWQYQLNLPANQRAGSYSGGEVIFTATASAPLPVPASTEPPELSETTPHQGTPDTVSTGSWSGTPTSYGYQWQRCDASGSNCADIAGATSSSYTPQVDDVGHTLRAKVTATNSSGSGVENSAVSNQVVPLPPATSQAPSISPTTPVQGETESATTGSWSNSPTSYTYQWQRCDAAGESCTDITGATSSTYTPQASDVGHTLVVLVTAENAGGSATQSSSPTATVSPAAPVAGSPPPEISGAPVEGATLSSTHGTFTGGEVSTYEFQWLRCNQAGEDCSTITGATADTYTTTTEDVGHTLVTHVRALNSTGSASETSEPTATIVGVPTESAAPAISPEPPRQDIPESVSQGSWSNDPTAYAYQWQLCDQAGENCTDIAGASFSSYTPDATDVGHTLRAEVTASNTAGEGLATSRASEEVLPSVPQNTSPPEISDSQPTVGALLAASTGSWSNSPTSYTYQWQRCDAAGENCTDIAGATSSSYTPVTADAAHTLLVEVTASNSGGSGSAASSAATSQVTESPANSALPTLSNTEPTVGVAVDVEPGTWSGYPAPTYSYQWQLCNAFASGCADIVGATSTSYTAKDSDTGHTLQAVVTATNTAGNASATTPASSVITGAPVNAASPKLSSSKPVEGTSLSVSEGTWEGYPAPTYAYQWEDCDSAGENCTAISGATASSYTPSESDVGHELRARVTATNSFGSTSATSEASAVVLALIPVNTAPPSVSPSTPQQGVPESTTNGSWSNSPTSYAYQWEDCDSAGENCTAISGATASSYTPSESDVGHKLRAQVTASRTGGSTTATSAATAAVLPAVPVNTAAPVLSSETPQQGATETVSNGSWSHNPTSFSYQWQRCNTSGGSCTSITGATNSQYTPTEADLGHTLKAIVTAENSGGQASASTAASGEVLPAVPANTAPPAISSETPTVGGPETASTGTWTNSPTSYSYQWFDCNTSGGQCSAISGATSSTYTPLTADTAHALVVQVTASNHGGSGLAASSPSTKAVSELPADSSLPALSTTTPTGGVALSVSNGTWSGYPAPTYSYQWQHCNAFAGNCMNIPGATSSSYTPVRADVGNTIRAVVEASNSAGSSTAISLTSEIVTGAPENTATPSLSSSSAEEGVSISVTSGTWSGYPAPTYSYQWQDCNSAGESCANISGATSSSYTPLASDVGHKLRAVVRAANSVGSESMSSAASNVVLAQAPVNTALPVITPSSPQQGVAESSTNGSWSHNPTAYSYQWEDCNSAGQSCSNISGATALSYTPLEADVGHTLRVKVLASNSGGSGSATSEATSVVVPANPVNTKLPAISPSSPQQGISESVSTGTWTNSPTSYAYQWERCNSAGEACVSISGATSSSYTPVEADVGHTLRAIVTATNAGGSGNATSTFTSAVLPAAPANTTPPSVSPAVAQQGVAESTTNGVWTNSPTSYTYQWEDCNSSGESCTSITGATSATYTPVTGDVGHTLIVVVTATNTGGHGTATSAPSKTVLPAAPVNSQAPAATPTTPVQGTAETATTGTWSNSPTSYTYQWERCTSLGTSCVGISGATSSSYTPVAADVGSTLVIQVTATNAGGSNTAASSPTSVVLGPPVNTAAPALSSPSPEVGVLDAVTTGTWTESPTAYTYKWEDCNSAGENCTAISGATSSTYTPVAGDVGERLIALVTASNTHGTSSPAPSPASLEVGSPVINTVAGSALTTYSGDGEPATTAGLAGTDDVAVDSAGNIYIAETAGNRIRKVTASTGKISTIAGNGTAGFSGDGALATAAEIDRPVSLAVDSAGNVYIADSGNNRIREVTASTGKISTIAGNGTAGYNGDNQLATAAEVNDPEGVAVDSAGNVYIADTSNYRVREITASTGKISTIAGTGTDGYNGDGILATTAEISQPEGVAVDSAGNVYIADTSNERIREVTASTGKISTVAGNGTSGYTGDGGLATSAEISTSYGVAVDSQGNVYVDDTGNNRIREVTASTGKITTVAGNGTAGFTGDGGVPTSAEIGTNSYGIAVDSAGNLYIDDNGNHRIREVSIARPPLNTLAPTLSTNSPQQNVSLSTSNGTWSNGPTSFSYQWERCNTSGASCVSISGATSSSYTPVEADVGHTLRTLVTASNSAGSRTATSTFGNAVLPAPPVLTTAPTLSSGTPVRGISLSTSTGAWTNSPTTYTYQWLRCNSAGESCVSISGATASSYTPVAADVNNTLKAQVTASNTGGSSSPAATTASATVGEIPSSATLPVLSTETPEQNVQMSVSNGTWNGVPAAFTYTYQWLRCNSAGESCVAISGATNSTYIPVLADVGNTLAAQVTATNTAGTSSPAQTTSSAVVLAAPPPPESTELPTISPSTPKQATAESTTTGTWSNSPTGYTYQWEDCNTAGESCASISGATSASYTPVASDVGDTLRVIVTATNPGGSGTATSAATATVATAAPVNTALPVISPSSPQQGSAELVTNGSWSNSPTSFTRQWEDCNSAGESCTNISGATASTYTPVTNDVGHTLKVKVTATNSAGSASATSAATAVVTATSHTQTVDSGNSLNAISCIPSTPDCVVSDSKGNTYYSTNVKINATATWTLWTGPTTLASAAISCPTTALCVLADGGSVYYATSLGGAWTLAFTPSYPVDALTCSSASFCVDGQDDEGGYIRYSTAPNSTAWTAEPIAGEANVPGVFCLSSSFCAAVDNTGHVHIANSTAQIESLSWTSTDVDGTTALNSVACVSTSSCVAVDGVGNVISLAISGSSATATKHNIDSTNAITSVACTGTSICVAVDNKGNVFLSANGGETWTKQFALVTNLTSVSCASTSLCAAANTTGAVTAFEG